MGQSLEELGTLRFYCDCRACLNLLSTNLDDDLRISKDIVISVWIAGVPRFGGCDDKAIAVFQVFQRVYSRLPALCANCMEQEEAILTAIFPEFFNKFFIEFQPIDNLAHFAQTLLVLGYHISNGWGNSLNVEFSSAVNRDG